jgi:hypothetical protein
LLSELSFHKHALLPQLGFSTTKASLSSKLTSWPGVAELLPSGTLRQLTEFTASRPALRAKLLNIVSADLAVKLTAPVSGLAAENIAAGLPQGGA